MASAYELCLLLLSERWSGGRLQELLTKLPPQDLVCQHPLPLYHAAAVAGRADAVATLAAAGVPISLADQHACLRKQTASLLSIDLRKQQREPLKTGGSALALAAWLGHAEVVRELLAAGADPDAGQPLPTLTIAYLSPPSAAAADIIAQLEAVGADVAALPALHAPEFLLGMYEKAAPQHARSVVTAHLFLARIYARSAASQAPAPATLQRPSALCSLLRAAAQLDDVTAFCHFAALLQRCLEQPVTAGAAADSLDRIAAGLLQQALEMRSHGVLQLAAAAAAAAAGKAHPEGPQPPADAAAGEVAAAMQLLGTHIISCLPSLLHVAVGRNAMAELQLLLQSQACPSLELISWTARQWRTEALRLLLAAGRPTVPSDEVHKDMYGRIAQVPLYLLPASSDSYERPKHYTCPLLALLQDRIRLAPRRYDKDCVPRPADLSARPQRADAVLLPVVEAFVEAGWRPAVYSGVEVQRCEPDGFEGPLEPPRLYATYDPSVEDEALDLQGHNRWLWMAVQRPEWTPAQHSRYPPSFRRAARTLLLVAHRLRSRAGSSRQPSSSSSSSIDAGSRDRSCRGCAGQLAKRRGLQGPLGSSGEAAMPLSPALLAELPAGMLLHVVGQAAYPLSVWAALDAPVPLGGGLRRPPWRYDYW